MNKTHFPFLALLVLLGCQQPSEKTADPVDASRLLYHLQALAHDSLGGRFFGTPGNIKAREFIASRFDSIGVAPAFSEGYIQPFDYTFTGRRRQRVYPIPDPKEDYSNVQDTTVSGANVAAMVKGKSDQIIVITAHLDHLGTLFDKIYNGADDDASGVAALISMAVYFKDEAPNHTLVFAAVDAEEIGMMGADYLLNHFPLDTSNIVLNINMDMIAHNDSFELYAAGLFYNPELKAPLKNIKSSVQLLFGHDNPDDESMDDWTFSSDHREFHKRGIPFIYFGVEDHDDYHQPTDTFENINQEFYIEAVKMIIQAIEGLDDYLYDTKEMK